VYSIDLFVNKEYLFLSHSMIGSKDLSKPFEPSIEWIYKSEQFIL